MAMSKVSKRLERLGCQTKRCLSRVRSTNYQFPAPSSPVLVMWLDLIMVLALRAARF